MKYAFIVLIALYLLVYGCGPDNSKKAEEKKVQTTQSTLGKPVPPPQLTQKPQQQVTGKQPVATMVETPQPTQQIATPPPSQSATEIGQQPPVIVEEQKTNTEAQERQQPPCKMIVHQPSAIELTQPDEENLVVMPCGCIFFKNRGQANAPCFKLKDSPCPLMSDKQAAAESDIVMMPCGRAYVHHHIPDEDSEFPQQPTPPCHRERQPQVVEDSQKDLATAMQKMVETTNNMVLATKQLVFATQEILRVTKGATNETAVVNQESLQANPAAQPARQVLAADVKKQVTGEQEVVDAMKEAVIAAQKAVEAMNQAVFKALEPKQN